MNILEPGKYRVEGGDVRVRIDVRRRNIGSIVKLGEGDVISLGDAPPGIEVDIVGDNVVVDIDAHGSNIASLVNKNNGTEITDFRESFGTDLGCVRCSVSAENVVVNNDLSSSNIGNLVNRLNEGSVVRAEKFRQYR